MIDQNVEMLLTKLDSLIELMSKFFTEEKERREFSNNMSDDAIKKWEDRDEKSRRQDVKLRILELVFKKLEIQTLEEAPIISIVDNLYDYVVFEKFTEK